MLGLQNGPLMYRFIATYYLRCYLSLFYLVRISGSTSGRVEQFAGGSWGTVCDDYWDLNDASVVCRSLGLGPAQRASSGAEFGQGLGPILLDNLECNSDELSLLQCPHSETHNCHHGEDAVVVCSNPTPGMRVIY